MMAGGSFFSCASWTVLRLGHYPGGRPPAPRVGVGAASGTQRTRLPGQAPRLAVGRIGNLPSKMVSVANRAAAESRAGGHRPTSLVAGRLGAAGSPRPGIATPAVDFSYGQGSEGLAIRAGSWHSACSI